MRRLTFKSVLMSGVAVFLFIGPWCFSGGDIYCRVLGMAYFYAAVAIAWNLLALTGSISLGHAAFFGLGAYTSALTSHYTDLSPYLCVLLGGLAGTLYAVAWHVAFGSLRGARYALATLASVEIPRVIADNWEGLTFGSLGLVGIESLPDIPVGRMVFSVGSSLRGQYIVLLLLMALYGLVHSWAIHSRWGWAMRATREDERAAGTIGVNTGMVRFCAVTLSAFLTGTCGALYSHFIGLIEPSLVFSMHHSAVPLVLSIFGGRFQFYGPILGALVLYPADQLLFHAWLPAGHGALYGLVIVLTLLFFPSGIGAWVEQKIKSS
jgi:branched-chain amino acid transport system permease protein